MGCFLQVFGLFSLIALPRRRLFSELRRSAKRCFAEWLAGKGPFRVVWVLGVFLVQGAVFGCFGVFFGCFLLLLVLFGIKTFWVFC